MLKLTRPRSLYVLLCCGGLALACDSDTTHPTVPPLPRGPAVPSKAPVAPAVVPPPPEAPAPAPGAASTPSEPRAPGPAGKTKTTRGVSRDELEPTPKAPQPPAPPPSPTPEVDEGVTAPVPDRKPETKARKPEASAFVMPGAAHVQLVAPSGLTADLAGDPRMKPWLDKGVAAANRCYVREAKGKPTLAGTIVVRIVMHENDRPDASIKQLPSQLSGVFACVTENMMKTRMPLFTGKEGKKYTARVVFKP